MEDKIIRAIAANGAIRAFGAYSRGTVEYALEKHNLSPVSAAALGRLMTGAAMMGSMLKNKEDMITLQIACYGPIKNILVTADAMGRVKGFVGEPQLMLPPSKAGKLDVGGAIGQGILTVIKDMGLKDPYAGQVEIQTGEIAEDLTYYFATSEQTPSCVGLGVLMNRDDATVKHAGGFIIQLMPNASDEILMQLEENIRKIDSVTKMLDNNMTIEDILRHILKGFDVEITDSMPMEFYCNCSRERIEKALISVGLKELQAMIDDNEKVVMNCHFCNTDYAFEIEEIKRIRDELLKSRIIMPS